MVDLLGALRARSRALDKLAHMAALQMRTARDPVAVYTLSKTASMALSEAIGEGSGRQVIHCHRVTQDQIRAYTGYRRGLGDDSRPYHDWRGEYLRHRFRLQPRRRFDIVCGVRDPVARVVSLLFHTGRQTGLVDPTPSDDRWIERLRSEVGYLVTNDQLSGLRWFEDELRSSTGVDVFAEPFDHEAGWRVYRHGRFRVLLIRFEDVHRVGPEALGSFLDVPPPEMREVNVGRRKPYADLLERFIATARFPDRVLDVAYDSQLARHFYTPAEIATFRARWSS